MKEKLSYEKAQKELESIVNKVENNELNVDEMVDALKRAQTLLAFCKEKLYASSEEIKKILENDEK